MGNKEARSAFPGSLEEELRQLALKHPGAKVVFDNVPLRMGPESTPPKTDMTPTVVHGIDNKGREVTFVCGPSHVGGLDPNKALELAVEFDETAQGLPSSPLKTAYYSRAEALLDHAAREELRGQKF